MRVQIAIWSLIAATGVIDGILLVAEGMTVSAEWSAINFIGLLCIVAVTFHRIPFNQSPFYFGCSNLCIHSCWCHPHVCCNGGISLPFGRPAAQSSG